MDTEIRNLARQLARGDGGDYTYERELKNLVDAIVKNVRKEFGLKLNALQERIEELEGMIQ